MPRNSEKMAKVIEMAMDNGGLDKDQGVEVYSSRQSFYQAVETLEERGLLERREAPMYSSYKYIWIATEKAESKVKTLKSEG